MLSRSVCYQMIFIFSVSCDCLRILGLFSHPGKSHFLAFRPLLRALAKRGHELTVVSHFPQEPPMKNYVDVNLDHGGYQNVIDIEQFGEYSVAPYVGAFWVAGMARENCEKGLSSKGVQEMIRSPNITFDLIVAEYFNSDCFTAFAHKFNVPVVGLSSCVVTPWLNYRFGNPDNPSYIPNIFLRYNDRMSFFERIENTFFHVFIKVVYHFYYDMPCNRIAKRHFGDELPALESIALNYTSLLLVNSHFSLNLPRPFVPEVVEVGGMALPKVEKLPENIEKWINESTHGVIYFSLGSMIKGHTFPEEKRQIFLRAFARLPQRVLWKWENDTMPGKPDNVMTQKWMPQFDILCHPNVRAFISHGGLLGTTEAVHCGVPAIVMPQFGDQYTNAKAWEANGGAVIMELGSVTDERLQEALQKVLDPKFREQAKELSARYRDRPMSPLDTAIYWVEYVARHKGAPFLRTAAVGMPFYKYLLLDVIAFLLLVLAVIVYVNYLFWRMILRKLFGKGQKVKTN